MAACVTSSPPPSTEAALAGVVGAVMLHGRARRKPVGQLSPANRMIASSSGKSVVISKLGMTVRGLARHSLPGLSK